MQQRCVFFLRIPIVLSRQLCYNKENNLSVIIAMPDPVYYHADCNSFFASVEETFHPEYKKVPMAVAGDPANRHGIILAKNELAKGYGIMTAETIHSAKRKCPALLLCPPRRGEYGEFCDRINAIYETYTDFAERFSIDESFLDMTFFRGDELVIAHEIRERVARETGITISIGVSWNRTFAKMGSDYKKPNAVTHITRENYQQILWPLPVGELFGVGRKMVPELDKYSIRTIHVAEFLLIHQASHLHPNRKRWLAGSI